MQKFDLLVALVALSLVLGPVISARHDHVGEMAKIHCFDPYGEFVKTTKISFFFMEFAPDGEGNFGLTGRVTAERSQNLGVMILNTDGEIVEKSQNSLGCPCMKLGRLSLTTIRLG